VNLDAAQVLKDMPDAIRSRLPGSKGRRTGRECAAQMVNFAHHAEVAILDENALTTFENLRNPRLARAPQANRTRHPELHVPHA
jgi:hypothetical protein